MLDLLERARAECLPVIIDDGSDPSFADEARAAFRLRGATVLERTTEGMGNTRRGLWEAAGRAGAEIIVWTEEKPNFVPHVWRLARLIQQGEADIVIAGRDKTSFQSYPMFQQHCETIGNTLAGRWTGIQADHWYSPRLWRAEMNPLFLQFNGEHWDSQLWPPIEAHAAGHKVVPITLNSVGYPRAQRLEEENNPEFYEKRYAQLTEILRTFREGTKRLGLPRQST